MSGNSFGTLFKLTTFGESHGPAIGGIVDGCPAGIEINIEDIQTALDRRRPGSTSLGTKRDESDTVEILSGIFEGKSTGSPIGFMIRNKDARSKDYTQIKDVFRPSHADFTYEHKYGIRDYRGGGRSSARETACRVAAGAIAAQMMKQMGIEVNAYVSAVGDVVLKSDHSKLDLSKTYESDVRCPDPHMEKFMKSAIEKVRAEGDSLGGLITCVVKGCPSGLGEPVFDKLNARLAYAMMGINATKAFEIGSGFKASKMKGSEHNDAMHAEGSELKFDSNNAGGVLGGISSGQDIYFRLAFKPVASISSAQKTVNKKGEDVDLELKGRHDPCVVPRAVPIVEAMTWLVLADHYLLSRSNKI